MKKIKSWEEFNEILYYQNLFYIFEISKIKLINRYHNDLLERYFAIKKTRKLPV